ncbi:MAG: hypothetical protein LBU25_08960, partial [Treponema sp.]|nr:hypothetical protein [Treponema sp.]
MIEEKMARKSFLRLSLGFQYQQDIPKEADAAARIRAFSIKKSLLYRASQMKEYVLPPRTIDFSHSEEPIKAHGIDAKDAQEIHAQIEALSRKNRITLSSQELKITPTKNGVVFPLVVNSFMWGITAGVLLLIGQTGIGDRVQSTYEGGFSSVEGQLIQQIRQDSEVRLSEKEQEIEAIRTQLTSLKTEELREANKFEALHKQREQELQTRLEQDLGDERKRLITTGIGAENMEALLAAYEQERFAYYRTELDAYEAQLEAEREAARVNYQQLQDKYQQDLRALNEERRSIQEQLVQNESQARLSKEAGGAVKAAPSLEGNAALEEARTKLVVFQEQQQQALLRDNRIIGMYSAIQTRLEQEQYREALVQAESLIRYLEETPQEGIPIQRRSLDIYLAGALARIARTELTRAGGPQITDLETQIGLLSADNARLTQVSQELSQALAEQERTRMAERADLDTRITRISA